MRAVVKIRPNFKGVRRIRTSIEVEAELRRRAERVAAAAGPGHVVDSQRGKTRARAAVITASRQAMVREGRDRNLTRAFNAARG